MEPNIYKIKVVEATTHYINIDCIENVTSKPFNLDGFESTFVLKYEDRKVYKNVEISENTVCVKLDPKDTYKEKWIQFECRIFSKEKDVYHVCLGAIEVVEAVDPLMNIEDKNKEEN